MGHGATLQSGTGELFTTGVVALIYLFIFVKKQCPRKTQNLFSKIILFGDIVILQWAGLHHANMLIGET